MLYKDLSKTAVVLVWIIIQIVTNWCVLKKILMMAKNTYVFLTSVYLKATMKRKKNLIYVYVLLR